MIRLKLNQVVALEDKETLNDLGEAQLVLIHDTSSFMSLNILKIHGQNFNNQSIRV
jgi:hypothetical protein